MSSLPQPFAVRRAPRVQLFEHLPAVLGFPDGRRALGQLTSVSMTGGVVSLPRPLARGSHVDLMFVSQAGPVMAAAEMLTPLERQYQPFRFVSLPAEDRNRLGRAIQSLARRTGFEQEWIEKFRTAVSVSERPKKSGLALLVTAMALGLLGSAIYVFQFHLMK